MKILVINPNSDARMTELIHQSAKEMKDITLTN